MFNLMDKKIIAIYRKIFLLYWPFAYSTECALIIVYRGSYMSAHVLLNLLKALRKRDKMLGLPSILSLFPNKFNKFINTGA